MRIDAYLPDAYLPPPPSRMVSFAVSAALVALWAFVRLVVFDTMMFPLTYVVPLFVCVWTRDRLALWGMTASFMVLHLLKLSWLLSDQILFMPEARANLIATSFNVVAGALAVHLIIRLRLRLERALTDVHAQAEELRAQTDELAQQNEELAEQAEELSRHTEELSQQGEVLASQNEEMQSQAAEIAVLNEALQRRERLLETLLEMARLPGGGYAALHHIAATAVELFGESGGVAVVYEQQPSGTELRAIASSAAPPVDVGDESQALDATPDQGRGSGSFAEGPDAADGFARLVLEQNRTAALDDVSLRPDLLLDVVPEIGRIGAVLGAPIRFGDRTAGVFVVYGIRPQAWTTEQFHLAEWLADQCGRALQGLRVQEDLRQADLRKSEFLATLSHELRNPLTPIRLALKLMEDGQTHTGNAVRIMQRQVQQLVRLVDDLLDATRLSSNKIQLRRTRSDLVTIVQQAVEASKPDIDAARHVLTVHVPAEPVWLDADADRLSQVVTNLVNNATRYTPEGGRVTVTVSVSGLEAVLSVADSGVGVHADDVNRVFEMFTQVGGPGSGGLGIGLAIVRGIVELHDGRAEVRSDGVGRGSEFRITLPVAASAVPEPAIELPTAPPASPRRVLVVDDNTDAATMMAALLEAHGHTVWMAHDAENALRMASCVPLDVALLDIGLPGLDGYELARRLRQDGLTRNVRLVAVTGWGQDGDRARARDAGFDAHLTKPAEPDLLLSVLRDESESLSGA
jgi:signal transduction histidine kinase/ActR/RegA family two-component response regulator